MNFRLVQEYGHWEGWSIDWYSSRTRGHRHAIITTTRPLPIMEKMLVACICATDIQHTRQNYCRVLAHAPCPILLIDKVKK